jgi:predicted DNA-binding transcriptional regulator AlpA
MTEFAFTLALDAAGLTDPQLTALYESVPDSTASERNGRAYVGIDREAQDFPTAVVSAIEDVERALPGISVVAIDPEELVSQADIAARCGRSREGISLLVAGERGAGNFPKPRYIVGDRSLWHWPEVEAWFDSHEGREPQARHDAFIDAVNAVLAMRQARPALQGREWDAVRRLAKETEPAHA